MKDRLEVQILREQMDKNYSTRSQYSSTKFTIPRLSSQSQTSNLFHLKEASI